MVKEIYKKLSAVLALFSLSLVIISCSNDNSNENRGNHSSKNPISSTKEKSSLSANIVIEDVYPKDRRTEVICSEETTTPGCKALSLAVAGENKCDGGGEALVDSSNGEEDFDRSRCYRSDTSNTEQKVELDENLDPKQACTMIYGGAEKIKVSGNINGKNINFIRGRSNGCAIREYNIWNTILIENERRKNIPN